MNNNTNYNKYNHIQHILFLYNNAKINGSISLKNKYYKQLILLKNSS